MPHVDSNCCKAQLSLILSPATTKVAHQQMTNSIKAYNSKVSNKSWKIQGRNHSILLSLSQASDRVIRLLEDHYSTTRHSEGALTMDQLSYCEWGVGSSRIPDGQINTPTMWKMIMTVTAGAIEEFASDLARRSLEIGSVGMFWL